MKARATAYANVALVKYFGKRDVRLNLPAASSLSLTLSPLRTETDVVFSSQFTCDQVYVSDVRASDTFSTRVSRFLDRIRDRSGTALYARVDTRNSFPTAAGLASSASGFAALTEAATGAMGLKLSPAEKGVLARLGSGSACRSMVGGIALWERGTMPCGSDSHARCILPPDQWDLRMVVGVTQKTPKPVGSTWAMEHTRRTSPYYKHWVETAQNDVDRAVAAIENRDFTALGVIAESNALSMHAAMMAARPGIVFLKGTTLEGYHLAAQLRRQGVETYFTCDAGPQPKFLCEGHQQEAVMAAVAALRGIEQVISCYPGGPPIVDNQA